MSDQESTNHSTQTMVKVEPQEVLFTEKSRLLVTLACGHSYVVLDGDLEWYEKQVEQGKQGTCLDCPVLF